RRGSGRARRVVGGGRPRRSRRGRRACSRLWLVRHRRARQRLAHRLLPPPGRSEAHGGHQGPLRSGDGGRRRGGQHRPLHRTAPSLLAPRRSRRGARSAPRALHAGRDVAGPARHETRAVKSETERLRALAKVLAHHARKHLWAVAAVLCGALVACFASALVAPLALAGGIRVQQAAALFRSDLETYRAAPEDLRASPLVCVAAAGYEDRNLFDRPRWAPPLSPTGLARAVARNLRGIPEGGSTIPQQIAKLYLRGGQRGTLGDKIREALFATWLVRQASPMELLGLYLNLGAGASIGGDRRPADGLDRLSLALFGLPLRRLSREDQLVLAGAPRGVRWLQAHPAISANRMA